MNRRGFLQFILAAAAAPAIVWADSLMRIIPRETTILQPEFHDGMMQLADLIAETIRQRGPELTANISGENVLLGRIVGVHSAKTLGLHYNGEVVEVVRSEVEDLPRSVEIYLGEKENP